MTPTAQTVSRARKRLLAELALQGNQLELDGKQYTKNDIQKQLDESRLSEFKTHAEVFQHPGLEAFLERQDSTAARPLQWNLSPELKEIISPGLGYSFREESKRLIASGDYHALRELMPVAAEILPEHQEEGLSKIRNYLQDLNFTVRNLNWEKFRQDESVLYFVFDDEWIAMINSIAIYQKDAVEDLVMKLLDVLFHFQRKATWYYLSKACHRLRLINTNSSIQSEVERFCRVFDNNAQAGYRGESSSSSSSSGSVKQYLFYAFWVIVLIFRIGRCNSDSSNDTLDNLRDYNMSIKNAVSSSNVPRVLKTLDTLADYNVTSIPSPANGSVIYTSMHEEFHPYGRNGTVMVRNESGMDMLVLLSQSENRSYTPGLLNYYVRNHDSMRIRIPNTQMQLNAAMGLGWGKLQDTLRTGMVDMGNSSYYIDQYFTKPALPQPWLEQTFYLGSQTGTVGFEKVGIYRSAEGQNDYYRIVFNRKKDSLSFKAFGNDMIYLKKKFNVGDSLQHIPAGGSGAGDRSRKQYQ